MAKNKDEAAESAVATPRGGDSTTLSSTDQTFADFVETLAKIDELDAKAKVTTTLLDYNSKRLARWKKKSAVERQEVVSEMYQYLNDAITVFAQKDSSEIKKKIDANIEAYKKNVGVRLVDTTKTIKDARTKLEILKKKGEELDTAANSHTMSSDLAAIVKIIGNKEDVLTIFANLKTLSNTSYSLADDTAEVAIRTSGLYASANVDSLKPLGTDIEKAATDLQTDVAKNNKDAATSLVTIRDEYQKLLQQLVESKYAYFGAQLSYFGVFDTKEKVVKPGCLTYDEEPKKDQIDPDKIATELEKLQTALEDNFKGTSTKTPA